MSSSSAMAGEGTLRVLTLNVFAGTREMDFDRLDRQMKAVRELQPDVVCLQEVYDHRVRTRYHAAFSDFGIYGDDHDTDPSFLLVAAELAASTAGEKAIAHGYRTDEVLLLNNQRGQSFPDSKIVHTFPNEAPDSKDAGGTLMSWGVSALESLKPKGYVSVRYQVDGVDVTVASMRLTNGVHNPKRAIQVKELIGRLFHTEDTENPRSFNFAPIILCGDTNADGEEPEMRWMREKAGFHDTYLEGNPDREHAPHAGMTWSADNDLTHNGNLTEPDQRVDYVLFAPGDEYTFETIGSRIVFDEAPLVSDHFGVLTELRLIRNPECTLNGIVLGTDACKKKFFEP
ncbi:MAG TPA: endonuclease/exonuclease/phosphatase family protein [Bdellovibrionota bacterium]|nr:endonuclease/exonuclease/phosphatase family protein [Bdellovibrionota bacterium]